MKFKAIVFVLLLLGSLLAGSGYVLASSSLIELQWSKTYKDYYASIIQTQDGGFLLAGGNITYGYSGKFSTYFYKPLLMKINGSGKTDWIKIYQKPSESIYRVVQTFDSGYLSYSSGQLFKTDSKGNLEWTRTFDDLRHINDLSIAKDGSYVIVGPGSSEAWFDYSVVLKYSAEGNLLWRKTIGTIYNGSSVDKIDDVRIYTVLPSSSGDSYYVAGGWIRSGDDYWDTDPWGIDTRGKSFWLAQLDSNGEIVWDHTYGYKDNSPISNVGFNVIVPTSDNGFILGGSDYECGWVVKTDNQGNEQWHWKYGRDGEQPEGQGYKYGIREVVQMKSGQYLVFNLLGISCLDVSGNELWFEPYSKFIKNLGSSDSGIAISSSISSVISEDGHLVVALTYGSDERSVQTGSSGFNLWVAKFVMGPTRVLGGIMLLCGVIVIAMTVFVGCSIYLKKHKQRVTLTNQICKLYFE